MDSRFGCAWLVVLTTFSVFPAFGQQSSGLSSPSQTVPKQDIQSINSLTATMAVLGGKALTTTPRAAVNVLISGTYTEIEDSVSNSSPLRIKVLGLDQIRWEVDKPEGTYVTLVMGGAGWRSGPKGKFTLPISGLSGKQLEILPVLALVDWIGSTSEVSLHYVATESLNGRAVDHVTVSRVPAWISSPSSRAAFEKMSATEVYIDSQNHLPAELHYNEHPHDARSNTPVQLTFSNYMQIGSFLFPMTIERSVMGVKLGRYDFKSVTFNAAISPSDFPVN